MRDLLAFQAARAREFFAKAVQALPREDARRFVAAEIMRVIYFDLLKRIEDANFDVFSSVVRVPRPRQASLALGVTKWRTTCGIVLPAAVGGILTGVVIAVARVAGETAPLLFTSSIAANRISTDVFHALPTLPVAIFAFADSADPADQARGWAAALVLIVFVLVTNILAKVFSRGHRR